jgi:hypothetical protein
MANIFKTRFGEAKYKLEQKIKKTTGSGLGLKGSVRLRRFSLEVNVER